MLPGVNQKRESCYLLIVLTFGHLDLYPLCIEFCFGVRIVSSLVPLYVHFFSALFLEQCTPSLWNYPGSLAGHHLLINGGICFIPSYISFWYVPVMTVPPGLHNWIFVMFWNQEPCSSLSKLSKCPCFTIFQYYSRVISKFIQNSKSNFR